MTAVRGYLASATHRLVCGTNRTMTPDGGCCGCGGPTADVYLTVGCATCGAPGEPYCWPCVDSWPADVPFRPALGDFTVFPGHER